MTQTNEPITTKKDAARRPVLTAGEDELKDGPQVMPARKVTSAKTAVFSLMLLSAFTKIFGFIREILLGRFFSIGDTAEAYIIAQTIPSLLLMVVGAGLSTGFIPVFNKVLIEKGKDKSSRFLSNTLNIVLIMGVLFCLLVTVYPEPFVRLFASGFTGAKLDLAIQFTRIAVWGLLFTLISHLLMPYLQIHDNFWVPAMVGIPMNLVFYLSYPAGRYLDQVFLPVGIILSALVQIIWMLPFVRREGYRWQPVIDFKDKELQHLLRLAAPVIVGVAVSQINVIVDRTMASRVLDGGVAALNYASKMNGFVQGIFIYSVIAVVYPRISRLFISKDFKAIEGLTTNAMVTMSLIVVPCMVGLMVFSNQIISLLFQGGEFDGRAVALTSGAMFWYAPSLIGYAFREIIARIFYSMNDTKTPTWNAAFAVAINIVLNIVLSMVMGINGLALATSISSVLSSFLLISALRRKGNISLRYRDMVSRLVRISLAALVMGAAGWFIYPLLANAVGAKLGVLAAIALAGIVYGVLILFLRIPEVDQLVDLIRQKLRRSR